jgi:hypothetical protein
MHCFCYTTFLNASYSEANCNGSNVKADRVGSKRRNVGGKEERQESQVVGQRQPNALEGGLWVDHAEEKGRSHVNPHSTP